MEHGDRNPLVVIATPTVTQPHAAYLAAVEAAEPALIEAGYDVKIVFERGNPYISAARATMLRKAMDAKADIVVFIDHDVSFPPDAIVRLVQTHGDVVAGTYRFKKDDEDYMGAPFRDADGDIRGRKDGAIMGHRVPAGFLKVTKEAVDRFMRAYPELTYGPRYAPAVDLFNHGAMDGVWYGEDYAFSKRWVEAGGTIWIVPDLDLTHHSAAAAYPGNFHDFLRRQPGGDKAPPTNN